MKYLLDYEKYTETAIKAVAEGQVLIKNENDALPIKKGSSVAVFGRIQLHYYKSGMGSGGMVNVNKIVGILDALKEAEEKTGAVKVYDELTDIYREWEKDHPIDEGAGWGTEPWCQEEMPLTEKMVSDAASNADYAIVVIGRTAGEDRDNFEGEGSYLLSKGERDMLSMVNGKFKKLVVILNVGNIMDMKFINDYDIDAVLYAWQGGMIGGYGTVKTLVGEVSPCGKLADTIAYNIDDYPSTKNFGDKEIAVYEEDIFVGYRYFETFAKDKVMYPFGYGLSYTSFDISLENCETKADALCVDVKVKNTGKVSGKEVVQVYIKAPSGKLSKPARILGGFEKTKEIEAGKEYNVTIDIPFADIASFDDMNACGLGTGFVLEDGTYEIYLGGDVRTAKKAGTFDIKDCILISKNENAMGPVKPFKRMVANNSEIGYEDAPLRKLSMTERRAANLPKDIPFTGDKGYKLKDVKEGKITMDEFIAQLDDTELCTLIRGEGMSSKLVTAGTAAAFGGITESLKNKGIPIGCMDDGPSGMRLDSGMKAFSLPNGTLLACTFDKALNKELYSFLAIEMLKNRVDVLLGPGMNIHRNPLNGRNFEYFSEDPILTGYIGAAQIEGLQTAGVTGTIKHFACNNQEIGRQLVDPIVSERALREIYLKGFEIAVKAGADSVMTTYSRLNGTWTSSCYDLNTTILRDEWGFKGIVMTDWWARISKENGEPNKTDFASMVGAQNDIYCCVPGATEDVGDNALSSLSDGGLTRGELQRTADNVCTFLMNQAVFTREYEEDIEIEVVGAEEGFDESGIQVEYVYIDGEGAVDLTNVKAKKGDNYYFGVELKDLGVYETTLVGRGVPGNELAQVPVTLFMHTLAVKTYTFRGDGEWVTLNNGELKFLNKPNVMHLHFALGGLELKELRLKLISKEI